MLLTRLVGVRSRRVVIPQVRRTLHKFVVANQVVRKESERKIVADVEIVSKMNLPLQAEVEVAKTMCLWGQYTRVAEVPEELANEDLLRIDPKRLSFVLFLKEDDDLGIALREEVSEKLEMLFPGCGMVELFLPLDVAPVINGKSYDVAGACLLDANLKDLQTLSKFAPLAFRANHRVATELFITGDNVKTDRMPKEDAKLLPAFCMDGVFVFPNEHSEFYIFEPRYKYMVKQCLENSSDFIICESNGSVGTRCRVEHTEYLPDRGGESSLSVHGVERVGLDSISEPRSDEFGLRYASIHTLSDETKSQDDDERFEDIFKRFSSLSDRGSLLSNIVESNILDSLGLNEALKNATARERFSWNIALYLKPILINQEMRKRFWLTTTDTIARLESILNFFEAYMQDRRTSKVKQANMDSETWLSVRDRLLSILANRDNATNDTITLSRVDDEFTSAESELSELEKSLSYSSSSCENNENGTSTEDVEEQDEKSDQSSNAKMNKEEEDETNALSEDSIDEAAVTNHTDASTPPHSS